MKNEEYMTNLQKVVENREPLKVYLKENENENEEYEFYDIFRYNEEKNIYQGQFGFLDVDVILKTIRGVKKYSHIKLEVCEERS